MKINGATLYVIIFSAGILFAVGVNVWPELEPVVTSPLGWTTLNLIPVGLAIMAPVITFLVLRRLGVFGMTKTPLIKKGDKK